LHRIGRRVALTLLLLGSFAVGPALATLVRQMSLEEIVGVSRNIVRGRVESTRTFWEGRQIWTEVTLAVGRAYKGRAAGRITFLQLGGRVESPVPLEMNVPAAPIHNVGDEAFYFLEPGAPGQRIIVGLFRGHVPVRRDDAGEYIQHDGRRLAPHQFEDEIRRALAAQSHGPAPVQ
jgi:hypothetical protein